MPRQPPANYTVVHLWLDLTRELQEVAVPGAANYGTQLADLLIRSAIYIGTVENRPMTATKIGAYVGIPRGSVVRHLRELERQRVIERHGETWRTPRARIDMLPEVGTASQLVLAAAAALSGRT